MKKILLLGAGRSSVALIGYLLDKSASWDTLLTVADQSVEAALEKTGNHARSRAIFFDATDEIRRKEVLAEHDLVISLLPPHLHMLVAKDCIPLRKNLITASYVPPEMKEMNGDIKDHGLLFMCEAGLDPGIDHMSAMKMIHTIKNNGGHITSFKSGTGGLVAPESDNNPWHYKITWNPRNIILAGQGAAQYLENRKKKVIPYNRLFLNTEKFKIGNLGKFESYPNRDSLSYIEKYELNGVETILRSTLRREGFCEAWNAIVQLGLTDDSYLLHDLDSMSYGEWITSYLPAKKKSNTKPLHSRIAKFLGLKDDDPILDRLGWLGLFSDEKIGLKEATPAQVLQQLAGKKWMMKQGDNDMIVMRHEVKYEMKGRKLVHIATLVLKGEDALHTAMTKTVGLPMGMIAGLMLQDQIFLTGVHIPVMEQVYEPVLRELQDFGIIFEEEEKEI